MEFELAQRHPPQCWIWLQLTSRNSLQKPYFSRKSSQAEQGGNFGLTRSDTEQCHHCAHHTLLPKRDNAKNGRKSPDASIATGQASSLQVAAGSTQLSRPLPLRPAPNLSANHKFNWSWQALWLQNARNTWKAALRWKGGEEAGWWPRAFVMLWAACTELPGEGGMGSCREAHSHTRVALALHSEQGFLVAFKWITRPLLQGINK